MWYLEILRKNIYGELMCGKQKLSYEDKMHIAKAVVEYGLVTKYVMKLYSMSVRWYR